MQNWRGYLYHFETSSFCKWLGVSTWRLFFEKLRALICKKTWEIIQLLLSCRSPLQIIHLARLRTVMPADSQPFNLRGLHLQSYSGRRNGVNDCYFMVRNGWVASGNLRWSHAMPCKLHVLQARWNLHGVKGWCCGLYNEFNGEDTIIDVSWLMVRYKHRCIIRHSP